MIFTKRHITCEGRQYNRWLIERIIQQASDPSIRHIVVDGFCGMGGVTGGFSQLPGWKVIACINHWPVAIETHAKNHPDCLHLLEDFRYADLTVIRYMIGEIKRNNPGVKLHCWFSLECTNFSNAKGGMSRDADSRTLADHVDRYVEQLDPDVIWIENVKEFRLWGPMVPKVISGMGKWKYQYYFNPETGNASEFQDSIDMMDMPRCPLVINKKKGTVGPWMVPDQYHKGEDFERWKKHICSFGYHVEDGEKLLNCADFGIPQHRVRLIMQFNRIGVPARFPKPTHDRKGRNGLKVWEPVKPCLDLEDEGDSVLSFKMNKKKGVLVPRISSGKTVKRLMNGIDRHVLTGEADTWIVKPNSAKNNTDLNNGSSLEKSSPTITCYNGLNVAKVHLVDHYFGNGYMKPASEPAGTTGTKDGAALHSVQFISQAYSGNDTSKNIPLKKPSRAITGTGGNMSLTTTHFINQEYSRGDNTKSVNKPSGSLCGIPKQNVVSVDHFLMNTQFDNKSKQLNETIGTITANRKYYYLVNFQWFNAGLKKINAPANTMIARQDKAPNYLITLETGELAIEVFEHDPPHYRELKRYMAANGIIAINMRMLKDVEMLRIMTIPEKTKLSNSSTANKKMIGNAVPSELAYQLGKSYDEGDTNYQTVEKAA